MTARFILNWSFTPPDFFEDPASFSSPYGEFLVGLGKVTIEMSEALYPVDQSLRHQVHKRLEAHFLAAQLIAHRPFSLSHVRVARVHEDGRRDAWAFPLGVTAKASIGSADVLISDEKTIIRDTRQERIARRRQLAERTLAHAFDPTLVALLKSYATAIEDQHNELVHLFELYEAIEGRFINLKAAVIAIGVSGTRFKRLKTICNNRTLNQARHRGQRAEGRRDATQDEVTEARDIAHDIVTGYLTYLEGI